MKTSKCYSSPLRKNNLLQYTCYNEKIRRMLQNKENRRGSKNEENIIDNVDLEWHPKSCKSI